jgi:hypothetical protein
VYSTGQRDGETKVLPLEPNIPMGYEGQFKFKEQGTMLHQDEMIVLYTDGITEARNEQHEMLGSKRWIDIITKHHNAFRDGEIKTTGTDIDTIMPPTSRFGGGKRAEKKQNIVEKLKRFFERFFGIG